jgi:hypothetical protein
MAFEADCGSSTLLETDRVSSTSWSTATRPLATCGVLVAQASRLHVRPGRPHHNGSGQSCGLDVPPALGWAANPKSEIRNPKSEIRNPKSEIPIAVENSRHFL